MARFFVPGLCHLLLLSCSGGRKDKSGIAAENPFFTRLDSASTRILFNNVVKEDFEKNMSGFNQGFYSGGGVAIGDVYNDGLDDVNNSIY